MKRLHASYLPRQWTQVDSRKVSVRMVREWYEWADIDLNGAEWRYTVTKSNTPHIDPLAN